MSPSFYQRYRTGDLMAHATNDINAVTMFAGGGVMSAVDASVTALVTLVSMFFMIDWRLTLLAILPLPVMVVVTSAIGRKTTKPSKRPKRLLRAEQLCSGISIRSQSDQILWLSGR